MRIDVALVETFVFGIVVLQHIERDDHQTNGLAYLGRSQAHAIAVVHGFKHVGNELLQAGIVGSDVDAFLAQHGHAVGVDGKYHVIGTVGYRIYNWIME